MVFKERWNQFNEMLTKSSNREYSTIQRIRLFIDFLFNRTVRGVYLIDYIQYHFYDRNGLSRDTFMEYQKLHRLMDRVNNKEKAEYFNSKVLFNKTFDNYLNRNWIDTSSISKDELIAFLKENKNVIAKPVDGSFGLGIEIYDTDQINVDELCDKYLGKEYLIESLIEQHDDLARLNKSTVNTLRVVTMIDRQGVAHIMDGVLRIGRKNKFTDNFHNQGLACRVDVDTGYVCTIAGDKDFSRYVLHPDSGAPICGFKVPSWDLVKDKCLELAQVIPDVRYVGWDIAVGKSGEAICIEGNYGADPDVTQSIDQIGKYPKYEALI